MSQIKSILVLGYHHCGEQDTMAPWEMLQSLAWVLSQSGGSLDVKLGVFDEGNINMQMGAVVAPQKVIKPDERADLLYVPGGTGSGVATKDKRILEIIQKHHAEGRWVATNCSGIAILQRAGILGKTPITAAATVSRRLIEEGANVLMPRRMWIGVPEAKLWTAAGGSAVHPSTIALAAHLFGEELGLKLSLMWDTLGAHGKALFKLEGPEYGQYPQYESKLQDDWEDMLLPKPEGVLAQ